MYNSGLSYNQEDIIKYNLIHSWDTTVMFVLLFETILFSPRNNKYMKSMTILKLSLSIMALIEHLITYLSLLHTGISKIHVEKYLDEIP
jgi:hypothetical protein